MTVFTFNFEALTKLEHAFADVRVVRDVTRQNPMRPVTEGLWKELVDALDRFDQVWHEAMTSHGALEQTADPQARAPSYDADDEIGRLHRRAQLILYAMPEFEAHREEGLGVFRSAVIDLIDAIKDGKNRHDMERAK